MNEATFKVDLGGISRVKRELLVPAAEGGARIAVNEIKAFMEDAPPRSGRTYLIPGTQTPYVASAPGEPPAIRTAAYRDSWDSTPAVVQGDTVRAAALSAMRDDDGDVLGESLEFGKDPVLPRPHIRPALPVIRRKIMDWLRGFGVR